MIKKKLIDGKLLPKTKLREAAGYFCGLIPYLKNYTQYADARLDNNVAERAIRPLAIGRKDWLFFGSVDRGEAGAIILSLVQNCRGPGINPEEYLEDIFRRLKSHNAQKLHELLPDQWKASRGKQNPSCCDGLSTKAENSQDEAVADGGASTEAREPATEVEGERAFKPPS